MEDSGSPRPSVTVVVATYDHPEALRLAIASVLNQSFRDWELLILGDACREETASVVASFDDPRLRYLNLARNYGEQSGPNNVGVARARGRYIAFLNHDDLWFPDHLQASIDWLEATGAELVFPLSAVIEPASREELVRFQWRAYLHGFGRHGRYDPILTFAPASSWVLRRETAARVGPWRPARECVAESSRDFLFRAWRAGLDMRALPWVSVLLFHSGQRPNSYRDTTHHEQAWFWERMRADRDLRSQILARVNAANQPRVLAMPRPIHAVFLGLAYLGIPFSSIFYRLRGFRRGQYIDFLRMARGLTRLPRADAGLDEIREAEVARSQAYRLGEAIDFRAGGAAPRFQARGWSVPEGWGTWAEGEAASLRFRMPRSDTGEWLLTAVARAFVDAASPTQRIHVLAGGREVGAWTFSMAAPHGARSVSIPAGAIATDGVLVIDFLMPDAHSPAGWRQSKDARRLGLGVESLRIESVPACTEWPPATDCDPASAVGHDA